MSDSTDERDRALPDNSGAPPPPPETLVPVPTELPRADVSTPAENAGIAHDASLPMGATVAKLFRYSIPVLCAFLAAAIYLIVAHERRLASGGQSAAVSGDTVTEGGDYYVTVSLVEVAPADRDGGSWESLGASGPDPYVEIWWQGSAVFTSSVKEDTLIASWSDTELSLRDMALLGKKVSVDDVRKGARINVRKGETIMFKVYDEDNLTDTLIGEHTMPVTDLRIGDQILSPRDSALRRMIIRTLPLKAE